LSFQGKSSFLKRGVGSLLVAGGTRGASVEEGLVKRELPKNISGNAVYFTACFN